MRYIQLLRYLLVVTIGLFTAGLGQGAGAPPGEAEFREHCAECHAAGGNMVNPAKTLSKSDREKHGVRSAEDIINIMRHPGEGMTVFDDKTLPDSDARKIAEYILTTFR